MYVLVGKFMNQMRLVDWAFGAFKNGIHLRGIQLNMLACAETLYRTR